MLLGVISDTHGYFDPRLPAIFEGVEHILHAGDIGHDAIIFELQTIAPVTAVLGNNDAGMNYRETEVIVLGGRKFLVHHIVSVSRLQEGVRDRVAREKPDVVVFGHTHQPYSGMMDNTLFFNPGYAGKPRFNLERSVALLHLEDGQLRPEFRTLPR